MDIENFKIFCINLDKRTDRWEESKDEFYKVGLETVCRFSAIEHENPIIGCALSHFRIMELWKDLGKHLIIFEDDVKFVGESNIFNYLYSLEFFDWDMLYLGANITTPIQQIKQGYGKLTGAQSTHAYCINKFFIPEILKYKSLLGKHMDLIYSENIIPNNNCLITIPILAIQRPSYSDIEKKFVNYDWMLERFNANLVERLNQ